MIWKVQPFSVPNLLLTSGLLRPPCLTCLTSCVCPLTSALRPSILLPSLICMNAGAKSRLPSAAKTNGQQTTRKLLTGEIILIVH